MNGSKARTPKGLRQDLEAYLPNRLDELRLLVLVGVGSLPLFLLVLHASP